MTTLNIGDADPDELLSPIDAARIIGVSERTMRRIVRDNKIEVVRPSPNKVQIRRGACFDYLRACIEPPVRSRGRRLQSATT